jgi:antitoxin HicB
MRDKVKKILAQPYSRILLPAPDGRFSAELLEFPGCLSQGNTPAEAYANLEEAAANWLTSALRHGLEIPPPAPTEASGRYALRLPRSLHHRAARLAARDGVSLNQFIVNALSEHVGGATMAVRIEQQLERRLDRLTEAAGMIGYQATDANYADREDMLEKSPTLLAQVPAAGQGVGEPAGQTADNPAGPNSQLRGRPWLM